MDPSVRIESFGTENQEWLGSAEGTDSAKTVTLSGAALGAVFTDGVVKSGTILGKITASGLYGPYDNSASDGTEVADGILLTTQQLNNPYRGDASNAYHNNVAPLMWEGRVLSSKLPVVSGPGTIDSAGKTDLKLIRFDA